MDMAISKAVKQGLRRSNRTSATHQYTELLEDIESRELVQTILSRGGRELQNDGREERLGHPDPTCIVA